MRSDLAILRLTRLPGCTVSHIAVYAALHSRSTFKPDHPDYGWAKLSRERMVGLTGLSGRTIVRCVRWLEAHRVVGVRRRRRADGKSAVNWYWLLGMPPDAALAPDPLARPSSHVPPLAHGAHVPPDAPPCAKSPPVPASAMCHHGGAHIEILKASEIPAKAGNTRDAADETAAGEVARGEVLTLPLAAPTANGHHANGNGNGNGNGRRLAPADRKRAKGLTELAERAMAGVVQLARGEGNKEHQRRAMASVLFAYWAARLSHENALFDPKREARLMARLKENRDDLSELLFVVDGARKDRNLMGENDRNQKYDGIETIFRDRAQVERLSALAGYRAGRVHPQLSDLLRRAEDEAFGASGGN